MFQLIALEESADLTHDLQTCNAVAPALIIGECSLRLIAHNLRLLMR